MTAPSSGMSEPVTNSNPSTDAPLLSDLTAVLLARTQNLHNSVCEFEEITPPCYSEKVDLWLSQVVAVERHMGLLDDDTPLLATGTPAPFLAPSEISARPVHPGRVLQELFSEECGMTQAALAAHIGVSRRTISQIVNGSRPITVDMAHRLGRAFGTSAQLWLSMQAQVDVWEHWASHTSIYAQITRLYVPNSGALSSIGDVADALLPA